MNDSVPVPRTCTEIGEDGNVRKNADGNKRTALAFEEFRDVEAYVLLGAPGAGKTTTFKQEAACSDACHVTARDFITFNDRPEWEDDKTLFIDGLDEMRARSSDGRTTLDEIRKKLDQLGRPRFRLSCREADWFGANDRNNLKTVSPNGRITVLRLDPLTDENIRKILSNTIDNPESFINEARRQGLEALLENPQGLWMLANAVSNEQWPETLSKTFEMACRKLLPERNQEHRLATQPSPSIDDLLDAAGRLCAVQLLTDKAGYTLLDTESSHEYPGLEEIHDSDRSVRHVLGTKLFKAPAEGRAEPVHRHIAEFLGGRYLAGLIENGLPVGRILALMTGDGGGVISNLRGLSAWLATHSPTSRRDIIDGDPIGTVLYGDVRNFSVEEKRRLLDGLVCESQKNPLLFGLPDWRNPRFGDLATREMREVFREMLTSAKRDEPHQRLVMVLVKVLRHGTVTPEMTDVVLGVVRDNSWYPGIREQALASLLSQGINAESTMKLLTDVHEGSVPDRDGDLLGLLLDDLYPSRLSASDILQYLQMPGNGYGMYRYFWNNVANRLTNAERAELLDRLVEQRLELRENVREHQEPENPAIRLPSRLLAGFLNESHEDIAPERLFGWLGLAALDFEDVPLPYSSTRFQDQDSVQQIRNWLNAHPETYKAMIALCVEDCRGKERFDRCVDMKYSRRLFCTSPPPDFGFWYSEQAMRATDDTAATWYIRKAAVSTHAEGAIRQTIEERLARHPSLKKAFRDRLSECEQHNTTHDGEEDNHPASPELLKFRDEVKKHIPALRENRCPPRLLDTLAKAYFGLLSDVDGNTPENRLHNLLEDDDLVETTLAAFRDSINRGDVPTDTEILRLREENRRHPLEHPCLAGLERSQPEGLFDEKQMRQALAFYYNSQALLYARSSEPAWYQRLLANHPEMVSKVLVEFVRSDIRRKKEHCFAVNNLAFSEEYKAVARLAVPPLLKSFPVRCTSSQLGILNVLLTAALRHCEENAFVALIEHKLSLSSLDVAQRVYWLAAGLFASPARYRPKIEAYLSGHERRIRHLAGFLPDYYNARSTWSTLLGRLDVQALALLIRLVGGSYRPSPDFITQMRPTKLVIALISQLATLPSPDATTALESLSSDEALHSWRSGLVNAALQQRAVRRETNFQHQDIPTVLRTLDNLAPANAADLAALTTDILSKIAGRIRDGNTSDWRQYWNVNSHNQPECPKPEDACRDALLSDLQLRLQPLGIDAQPEGRYANDKRADIRVTYGDFNVPAEIKRNNHRDLWHAIKEQLIAQYTRDPGADGRGIYLVFWFGAECQRPPSGPRPGSASKLEELLRNMLSEEEQAKISILVIDVSKCENEG